MPAAHPPRALLPALACLLAACDPGKLEIETGARQDSGESGREDSAPGETAETGETGQGNDSAETGETGQGGDSGDSGDSGGGETGWAEPCATLGSPVQTGIVADEDLNELSGLAVSRLDPGVLWTHEDHGGEAALYALDTLGNTLATVTLEGATNEDWEDIAIGPCGEQTCIFVGEIGNNDGDRTELGVYALVEPDLSTAIDGELSVSDWSWYGMSYPGAPENAEALAITAEGLPLILTKVYEEPTSNVYIYPALDDLVDAPLELLGTLVTGEEDSLGTPLTAADLWPDDARLIFRTYAGVYEVELGGGLEGVSSAPITPLAGAPEMHGEAVAYDPWRGGFWQVAEGLNTPIWFTGCAG